MLKQLLTFSLFILINQVHGLKDSNLKIDYVISGNDSIDLRWQLMNSLTNKSLNPSDIKRLYNATDFDVMLNDIHYHYGPDQTDILPFTKKITNKTHTFVSKIDHLLVDRIYSIKLLIKIKNKNFETLQEGYFIFNNKADNISHKLLQSNEICLCDPIQSVNTTGNCKKGLEKCICKTSGKGIGEYCSKCPSGYYRTMDSACIKCPCDETSSDGQCIVDLRLKTIHCNKCKVGYFGQHCENCAHNFYRENITNTPGVTSKCTPCKCKAPTPKCNQDTGHCEACSNVGATGTSCEQCKKPFVRDGPNKCLLKLDKYSSISDMHLPEGYLTKHQFMCRPGSCPPFAKCSRQSSAVSTVPTEHQTGLIQALSKQKIEKFRVICQCPSFCTMEYAPVCGSNGETYGNECAMKIAACNSGEMISISYHDECGTSRALVNWLIVLGLLILVLVIVSIVFILKRFRYFRNRFGHYTRGKGVSHIVDMKTGISVSGEERTNPTNIGLYGDSETAAILLHDHTQPTDQANPLVLGRLQFHGAVPSQSNNPKRVNQFEFVDDENRVYQSTTTYA